MVNINSKQMQLAELEVKYNKMRFELLAVVFLTALNVIQLIFGSTSYFLFSASLPYTFAVNMAYLTGRFPAEYYEGIENTEFYPETFFWAAVIFAFAVIAVYLVCFLLSKKKHGWMIAAMVLFAIDTGDVIINLFGYLQDGSFAISDLIDFAFHAVVLAMLIYGVVIANKIKKVKALPDPVDDNTTPEFADFTDGDNTDDFINR